MSDPVFDTDLRQRSLVEASAGTGKTYALAGLFARAVIVERLRVPQVLAVTYTVAATQELHERVRLRLQQALALAQAWREGDDDATGERDGNEQQHGEQGQRHEKPHVAMLRRLLRQAMYDGPRESLPALRLRLARALRDMDLAAISTIHGFCQRVLREHALETQQPLTAATLEAATAASRQHLAADLWRKFSRDSEGASFLRRRFGRLDALAASLRDLLAPEPLLPPAPTELLDPRPALAQAWQCLAVAHAAHGESARAAVEHAIAGAVLKSNEYKPDHVASLWQWLQAAARTPATPAALHPKLHKYLPATLEKGTLKAKAGRTPTSPLFDTFEPCIDALHTVERWQEARDLQQLHALRAEARRRDQHRKQALNVRDYDDLIGELHAAVDDEPRRERLMRALRRQFPCVLVDEFQDTDAWQWQIFARLFGEGGLVLVGDPKQAIYRFRGGDVNTYVAAADTARRSATLERNFRSRPCVIDVVNALFDNTLLDGALFDSVPPHAAMLGDGIAFRPTRPGGTCADSDLLLGGEPAPALHFHIVPTTEDGKEWNKPVSLRIAAALCADAILQRLQQAGHGHALRLDARLGTSRPLLPRDFAVLVRDHRQAAAIRHALSLRGVPAVSSGRESLYQGDEAQDILTLLLALQSPGDDRPLRAALATPLLGWNATRIFALDEAGETLRDWQQRMVAWRARWERHGPQAMLAEVLATHAERLLQQQGGERRLTNYLQLGELMQSSVGRNLGTQGQLDALRRDIAHADGDNEAQQPRLESDAGRVQILTLHKSKGLEFPLVYLPFAGIGRKEDVNGLAMYTVEGRRVRQWKTEHALGALPWQQARQAHLDEEAAEDMRLLYVGLTRASDAIWLCCGALSLQRKASLHRLLGGPQPSRALIEALDGKVTSSTGMPPGGRVTRLPAAHVAPAPAPRSAQRRLQRNWWIHSFSQLHKQPPHGTGVLIETRPADDEAPLAAITPPRRRTFAGPRFGNVLHHALEHVDFAAWRDHEGDQPPTGQAALLIDALNSQGYAARLHEAGVRELTPLVAHTLNVVLPERVRLCDLPPAARIVELEFHLALRGASVRALLDVLHRHELVRERHDFGAWTQLAGLLNGKIDLTYRHDGRVYVLDYKSNDLPDYDPSSLARTMAASEYDLQALIYTLAVHRWMQWRMGKDYDYERDFGGVRYVFCRGLDVADPSRGVFVPQFSRELIEAVDTLLISSMEPAA